MGGEIQNCVTDVCSTEDNNNPQNKEERKQNKQLEKAFRDYGKKRLKPIATIKEVSAHENKWIKLYFNKVAFYEKDGTKKFEGQYNKIVNIDSKKKECVPGSLVMPYKADKTIGLIYQYRYPIDQWSWELI